MKRKIEIFLTSLWYVYLMVTRSLHLTFAINTGDRIICKIFVLSSKKIWGAKREVRFLIFNPTNSTIHLTGSFNHLFTRHIIQAAYVRRCRKWQKRLFNIFCFRTCRAHQRCYFDSTMAVIMCVIKVKEHRAVLCCSIQVKRFLIHV